MPSLQRVRRMLHIHVADALDFDEVRRSLQPSTPQSVYFLEMDLEALETVLAEPQLPGTLLGLVEGDANMGIDHDQTDRGAAVVLREIADMLRSVIAEARRG
ncbi:MAG TPA: hypothetical protein VN408_00385 [Actinoplanes sp.]|nr:hypothetical protein [Actinoplanes sp.]